jgi:multicomponent Na+:H+ antiporter subunit F
MTALVSGVALVLALSMALSLYRVVVGPTIFDRLTGLGLTGTSAVILLLLVGLLTARVEAFVDITLAYALISFVGTLTLAKYFEHTEAPPQ